MTDPTLTGTDLDLAIIDAIRTYIAAARAYPRDQARIAAARQAIDDLTALRDAA